MLRFLSFLLSVGAGIFLAGLLAVGGLFLYYDRNLPDHTILSEYEPEMQSRLFAADGEPIAEFVRERRIFIPYEEVPAVVVQAFVSAEDKNFFLHAGVDPEGLLKAGVRNIFRLIRGQRPGGASTITQQVVKNFLLSRERRLERKIKEMILAVRVETLLSKEEILELYLNDIFLGVNAYGIGAAALNYFGKSLDELTLEEAAYLAALPKAPSDLHPIRDYDYAVDRRNYVLGEMLDNGYIDQLAHDNAVVKPLETIVQNRTSQRGAYRWDAAYAIEAVRGQALDMFGERGVYGGGMIIRSTIDLDLQQAAAAALIEGLHRYDRSQGWRGPAARLGDVSNWPEDLAKLDLPRDLVGWPLAVVLSVEADKARIGVSDEEGSKEILLEHVAWARRPRQSGGLGPEPDEMSDVLAVGDVIYVTEKEEGWGLRQLPEVEGAVVALDPHTGRVLAMQGGASAERSDFNRVSQADRQPGSSIKPIVYAAALDAGYTPATLVMDGPFTNQEDAPGWRPENYSGRFYGWEPLRRGLERSYNMMTLRLAYDVGLETIKDYTERLGIYDNALPHWAMAIGSGETTLLRMATAYGIFVNGGRRIEPSIIDRIQNRHGDTLFRADERMCEGCDLTAEEAEAGGEQGDAPVINDLAEQVIDPVTAYQVVSLMEGVVSRGTAHSLSNLGFPVGGKTGTTNDAKDAWFIGFTDDLIFGCYVGYDEPRSLGRRASGGGLCGPVFRDFMRAAYAERKPGRVPPPEEVEFARVDRFSGRRVPEDAETPEPGRYIQEAFRTGTTPPLEDDWRDDGFMTADDGGFGDPDAPFGGGALMAQAPCGEPGVLYGDGFTGQLYTGRYQLADGCVVELREGRIVEIIENPNQPQPVFASQPSFQTGFQTGGQIFAGSSPTTAGGSSRLRPPSGDLIFDELGRLVDPATGYEWDSETGYYRDPATGLLVDESGTVVGGDPRLASAPVQPAPTPGGGQTAFSGAGASLGDSFDGGGLY